MQSAKQSALVRQVPVIEDDGKVVNDSFAIAQYLESKYADRPSLFGGPGGEPSMLPPELSPSL